jgi:hypothetical protein
MKPNFPWNLAQRALALALATLLCGGPQLLAQTAQSTQSSNSTQSQQQAQPTTTQSNPQQQQQAVPAQKPSQSLDVDPSKGPLQPVPSSTSENEPATPNAQQPANAPTPQPQTQKPQTPTPAPQGVAVAGEAKTSGGPASEPAGTAIAPAKQHQMRSLLIKIGAIGAGAAALGAIYALSRGTSSHPPNAAVGTTQAH